MKRFERKRIFTWLLTAVALTMLAACGTTDPDPDPEPEAATLTVDISGNGTVTGTADGDTVIDCSGAAGDTCSVEYDLADGETQQVSLTAVADTDNSFSAWSGDCTGTDNTCTITLDSEEEASVTATFEADDNGGGEPVSDNYRRAYSYEGATAAGGTASAPVLMITYSDASTQDIPVDAGNEDAEELLEDSAGGSYLEGYVDQDSGDLELNVDPSHGTQAVGMFFDGLTVPAGETVESAFVRFTADGASDGDLSVTIAAQESASATTFPADDPAPDSPSMDISSRATLDTTATWDITEAWADGSTYDSADIADVLNAAIAEGDFANDVALIITPNGTTAD